MSAIKTSPLCVRLDCPRWVEVAVVRPAALPDVLVCLIALEIAVEEDRIKLVAVRVVAVRVRDGDIVAAAVHAAVNEAEAPALRRLGRVRHGGLVDVRPYSGAVDGAALDGEAHGVAVLL